MSSVHDKLARVRKPRVHITYEVETEGAQIERELPFVVGIMGLLFLRAAVLGRLAHLHHRGHLRAAGGQAEQPQR